jgi:hypothetical protein
MGHVSQIGFDGAAALASAMLAIAVFFGRRRDDLQRRRSAPSHPGGGDDRVSGTDAERHDVFITTAVLGLAATLIGLKWLI